MSKQVIEQVNENFFECTTSSLRTVTPQAVLRSADVTHFSVQLLEANSMKGGVELLEIRPEQLTSNELGEQQVLWNQTLVPLGGGKVRNSMALELH